MKRWFWPFAWDRIVVEHARRPKEYHLHFIIFLLAVIIFCLLMLLVGVR
jgi:prolipoprotein diacylglyceryltransferase